MAGRRRYRVAGPSVAVDPAAFFQSRSMDRMLYSGAMIPESATDAEIAHLASMSVIEPVDEVEPAAA